MYSTGRVGKRRTSGILVELGGFILCDRPALQTRYSYAVLISRLVPIGSLWSTCTDIVSRRMYLFGGSNYVWP